MVRQAHRSSPARKRGTTKGDQIIHGHCQGPPQQGPSQDKEMYDNCGGPFSRGPPSAAPPFQAAEIFVFLAPLCGIFLLSTLPRTLPSATAMGHWLTIQLPHSYHPCCHILPHFEMNSCYGNRGTSVMTPFVLTPSGSCQIGRRQSVPTQRR